MQRYAQKRLQEENEMRDLVQQVAEGHKNSKAAKEKLQKLKQKIGILVWHKENSPYFPFHSHQFHANSTVKEVSEQRQELLRQALEEAQAELSRKFEIIKEIHTIESLPHVRVKNFNDTVVSERNEACHALFHIHTDLTVDFYCVRLQAMSLW